MGIIIIFNDSVIVNSLNVGYFNKDFENAEEIKLSEFKIKMKEAIYKLEIDQYWNNK